MKIIYNNLIPFKGFIAINLFGVLFVRNEYKKRFESEGFTTTLNHESIHTEQIKELGYIFFYIWYFIEWLLRLPFGNAYYNISFEKFDDKRILKASMKSFLNGKDINLEFELSAEPKDSMVIITPFKEKKTAFYYNQKIVGFKAKGTVSIGDDRYIFNESNTRAILDWGRGVWTYKNTWYWGAGCGVVDGHEFGFNIGYGFGDTSSASENMLFYDGVAHKLDKVTFNIPKNAKGKDDYLSQWTFTSNDGRFEMTFDPIIDRHANANALIISSNQHQVFGRFNGTATLDNGEKVVLKDFVAFAEKVKNKW